MDESSFTNLVKKNNSSTMGSKTNQKKKAQKEAAAANGVAKITPPASPTSNAVSTFVTEPRVIPHGARKPPVFDTLEAERLYRKQRLALAFRIFAAQGFDEGVAGHITVRDPIKTDHFWVNPYAVHFAQIRVSDLLLVNHDGQVVEGTRPVNAAAFAIHAGIHSSLPHVNAAAHSHSMYGKAWSALDAELLPITQDACAFYERHAIYKEYNGVVLDTEEGKRIAKVAGEHGHGVILSNHGLLTVGETVEEAVWWFMSMDRCCQAQMLAEATGRKLKVLDHKVASHTRDQVGGTWAGWFMAQTYFDLALQNNPDVFE
ncbi:hypothetical protein SmJEL517_g04067 [Synchytrium microbalum]|uniref:Class II aldolase/adducin N-terminal domain-containing protein n=1 Tax=Synchytrium microbalum TaxID=1806994 RepID=A0A507C1H2_9FUNG|nr:uncharacterized protein SmJEL517_g04067 [Synchytrium microbalum]TPX32909.1 hypothetical protein SmJEL517_g04067 [Synchytrium microbalum]